MKRCSTTIENIVQSRKEQKEFAKSTMQSFNILGTYQELDLSKSLRKELGVKQLPSARLSVN